MAQTERERKTQEKTMRVIRKYNGYVYKNAQSMYTEKGRPDLTACVPTKLKTLIEMFGEDATVGIFLGIEMKRPGALNDVSTAQEIVGRQIRKAKGMWLAIDDPDVIEVLMNKLTKGVENEESRNNI